MIDGKKYILHLYGAFIFKRLLRPAILFKKI